MEKASIQKALNDARLEVKQEKIEKAKEGFKRKLRDLAQAEKVVANLEREIEDLEAELSQGE